MSVFPSLSYKPRLSSQQFLHHALLEGAGLVTSLLESGKLGVHVGEGAGDSPLLGKRREGDIGIPNLAQTNLWIGLASCY
jgi:hypothetical protein